MLEGHGGEHLEKTGMQEVSFAHQPLGSAVHYIVKQGKGVSSIGWPSIRILSLMRSRCGEV